MSEPKPGFDPRAWSLSEWIFRAVGAVAFIGTLVNMIYGFQTIDPNDRGGTGREVSPIVLHVFPFFIIGLLGLYAAWYGPPTLEGIEERDRREGWSDLVNGVVTFVLGIGVTGLVLFLGEEYGLVFVATGMLGGGVVLTVKGLMTIFSGRDFS